MREVKFRAWTGIEYIYEGWNVDTFVTKRNIFDYDLVEQFTGLKDKNGVDIYEGDILKVKSGSATAVEVIHDGEKLTAYRPVYNNWVVVFYKSCFGLHNSFDTSEHEKNSQYSGTTYAGTLQASSWDKEVIGNIHDNPDLL